MGRWIWALGGALLLTLGLVACATSVLPPLPDGVVRAQRVNNGLTFTLDSPTDPRINHAQHLRVTLVDTNGHPVDAKSVYFDMKMNMICLSGSKPVAKALGQGGYEVDVIYVMAGDWQVTAVADLGDHEQQVTFPITVKE
jgi:hypothetical protein